MNQDIVPQPISKTALNIIFVGETDIGESSIIDFVADSGEQKNIPRQAGHRNDVRSVTLDGKIFVLHAFPANESMSATSIEQGIQDMLADLRSNGGAHLLVYCMNALHTMKWTRDVYRAIASQPIPSPRIPAVAVVAGLSDAAQEEGWWSSKEVAFARQGPHFDQHAFIQMMTTSAQSPTSDHVSGSRHVLRELILQNYARAFNSEANSFQPGKPPSHISANSKDIEIVLLGETGVGKSSLINLIARRNVAEVSSDTIGCTRTIVKYTFEEKGRTFHLYDTPGLVDPLMDVERFVALVDTIQRHIRSLGNGNGPDLLLFCIDKPTAALKRNYRLFCKVICGDKVPFALAVTKLEEGQDADKWWRRYGDTIRKYGIDRSRCVALGCGKGRSGANAESEGRLRESLLSFFVARTGRSRNRVASLYTLVVSVAAFLRSQLSTPERTLMNECELEERTARELINRMASPEAPSDAGVHT